jgi:hypothetical protein
MTGRASELRLVYTPSGVIEVRLASGQFLGTTTPEAILGDNSAPIVNTIPAAGAAQLISTSASSAETVYVVTLTAASCTLSLSGAQPGKRIVLELWLRQDSTGNRTITWPGSISWDLGAAPILSTAANKTDIVRLVSLDGGFTWLGTLVGSGFVLVTPPAQVQSVSATSGDTTSSITWSAPSNGGSAITDYVVQYKATSESTWLLFVDAVSTTTSATVTGLVNDTSYDFRVAAKNAAGQGPFSSFVSATPTGTPATTWPSAPPTGARFSSGQDVAYLSGPSSAPVGAIVVNPGTNLYTVTQANPAGTTFYLTAGTHTLGNTAFDQVIPKNSNTYIGAPGAIMDGQNVNRYFTTGEATGVTIETLEIKNFNAPTDEFVVNHDTASGFTLRGCNVHHNNGAAVGVGSNNTLEHSWLHHNSQYGFSVFNMPTVDGVNGVDTVVVDTCEIANNGTTADEIAPDGSYLGNGRNGGCKFWDTKNITMTDNWVHDNNYVGIWADTNNAVALFDGNYIADNFAEGLFYEISYNFRITNNAFLRNNIGRGLNDVGNAFPRPALYISESGGSSDVSATYATSEVANNYFKDNWDEIVLWENADRFCNSPANTSGKIWRPIGATLSACNNPTAKVLTCSTTSGSNIVTITGATLLESTDEGRVVSGAGIPGGTQIVHSTPANGFDNGFISTTQFKMTANATATATGVTLTLAAGTINGADYDKCRWETKNVSVHNNKFERNASRVLNGHAPSSAGFGRSGIISNWGSYPAWSPYTGMAIMNAITTVGTRNNVFTNNEWHGAFLFLSKDLSPQMAFSGWQATSQDSGSTLDPSEPA